MSVENVRVPPDSTGKRIFAQHNIELAYSSGTIDFVVGDIVVGQTSGAAGTVINIDGTTATGELYLTHNDTTSELFTVGENLQVNAVTNAIMGSQVDFYTQNTVTVGSNNPFQGQTVDEQGAANVRFSEGAPQFDSFGKLRTSTNTLFGDYTFHDGTLPTLFTSDNVGAGTVTHDATSGALVLTNTTASGDVAKHTSDVYHHYFPGISQNLVMTVVIGDSGKTNVRRRWGYFDDNDGLYFQLDGTTLSVVERSSVSGSVVDTVTAQSAWSTDRVNGLNGLFNLSLMNLDVTKDNIYWIDYQWLGAGRVRYGVYYQGVRIVLHESFNANVNNAAYMRTGSLPVRYEQENTGVSGSTSELRTWCASVSSEHTVEIREFGNPTNYALPASVAVGASRVYLFTIRPKATFGGRENHSLTLLQQMSIAGIDSVTFGDGLLKIEIFQDSVLGGTPVWNDVFPGVSTVEVDTAGTLATPGAKYAEFYVKGIDIIDFSNIVSYQQGSIKNKADGAQTLVTITATRLSGANDVDTNFSVFWKEFQH